MPTTKTTAADAAKGTATIKGFRYAKEYCIITLDNEVTGIIGKSTDLPLATMLTLKGQQISYEYAGTYGEYKRYNLIFALY
jgi:hypothetical protein